MKLEKLVYESARIDVIALGISDIVTSSESSEYVDPDGWDGTN